MSPLSTYQPPLVYRLRTAKQAGVAHYVPAIFIGLCYMAILSTSIVAGLAALTLLLMGRFDRQAQRAAPAELAG
jgi:hypothetical protein